MECLRCGSHNIQTFEMAHASYNVGVNSWSTFLKLSIFGLPGLLLRPSQNSVARRTSPPAKPVPALAIFFVFIFFATFFWLLAVYARDGFNDPETQFALAVNGVVFSVAFIVVMWDGRRSMKASRDYPKKLEDWIHSWICLQCGTTYKLPAPGEHAE